MAAVTPDIGQGLVAAFQFAYNTTGTTETFTLTQIQDIRWTGASRDTYNAKNLSTTGPQPFLASKSFDAGEISINLWFDTDGYTTTGVTVTPITMLNSTVLGTLFITWPDLETFTCRAWCAGFEVEAGEEVMTSTLRFKVGTTVTF